MTRYLVTGSLFLALSVSALQAQAADPTYPVDRGQTNVEYGSGWYLRGDIGYNFGGEQKTGADFIPAIGEYLIYDYSDAISLRAGFGYQLNPHFRLEASIANKLDSEFRNTLAASYGGNRTIEMDDGLGGTVTETVYFDDTGTVTGTDLGLYTNPTAPTINGTQRIDASYNSQTFLVNGYFDLPKMGRFTPYVGAGGGLARISYSETRVQNCVPGDGEVCNAGDLIGTDYTSTFWSPAYSVSAGTAYQINERLSLDLGYSFLSVDDGPELNYDDGTAIDVDGYTVHQLTAGLRYQIW